MSVGSDGTDVSFIFKIIDHSISSVDSCRIN